MKKLLGTLLIIATVGISAHAAEPTGILLGKARMQAIFDDGREIALAPTTLAMYGNVYSSGKSVARTLVLTQDTGIRCITTPCPSSKDTVYTIVRTDRRHGVTRYVATEQVSPMDEDTFGPRTLELVDYTGAPHVRVQFRWFAKVTDAQGNVLKMGGNPSAELRPGAEGDDLTAD